MKVDDIIMGHVHELGHLLPEKLRFLVHNEIGAWEIFSPVHSENFNRITK